MDLASAIQDHPTPEAMYGYDLAQRSDLPSGVLYPILARLEGAGWLMSDWAEPNGSQPRRRYYKVTTEGASELNALAAKKVKR